MQSSEGHWCGILAPSPPFQGRPAVSATGAQLYLMGSQVWEGPGVAASGISLGLYLRPPSSSRGSVRALAPRVALPSIGQASLVFSKRHQVGVPSHTPCSAPVSVHPGPPVTLPASGYLALVCRDKWAQVLSQVRREVTPLLSCYWWGSRGTERSGDLPEVPWLRQQTRVSWSPRLYHPHPWLQLLGSYHSGASPQRGGGALVGRQSCPREQRLTEGGASQECSQHPGRVGGRPEAARSVPRAAKRKLRVVENLVPELKTIF